MSVKFGHPNIMSGAPVIFQFKRVNAYRTELLWINKFNWFQMSTKSYGKSLIELWNKKTRENIRVVPWFKGRRSKICHFLLSHFHVDF